MARIVEVDEPLGLEDYAAVAHLSLAVRDLRSEAEAVAPALRGRTVWMVNSAPQGGGVAEMLPKVVSLLGELGIRTRWAVIESGEPGFFDLTKRIHNLIHGWDGGGELGPAERELYEGVGRENAAALRDLIAPRDVLVVHDPQPLVTGAVLRRELGAVAIWRCHIGLDERLPATRMAWRFLRPYASEYDHAVFSAPEYIPSFLAGKASLIHPGIDPLSHKNRELSVHKLVGILCNAGLAHDHSPVLTLPFEPGARRLLPEGGWAPAARTEEIGLLSRPVVTQVSRWDRLKGFAPLLDAFALLKTRRRRKGIEPRHRRRLEILRLVLAGPDPSSVADDPEAREVLEELEGKYMALDPELRRDAVLLTLPMASRKENALMVNALQRCASVVVQNSLREGFGLTVAEALWKRNAVVASRACGIRVQIRDGLDGRLVEEATDPEGLAEVLDEVLADPAARDLLARSGQRRVHDEFLILTQLRNWLRTLAECLERRGAG